MVATDGAVVFKGKKVKSPLIFEFGSSKLFIATD